MLMGILTQMNLRILGLSPVTIVEAPMIILLQESVTSTTGQPIGRAEIRLVGDADTLGTDPCWASNDSTRVTWTRGERLYAVGLHGHPI